MCLILLAWQVHPDYPLIIAANRDEFHARRSASADYWPDHPQVLGGRDLEAGGSWLGIASSGKQQHKFAALTNFRDPTRHQPGAPSRGQLVADYLCGTAGIDTYLDALPAAACNGFNLLLGDGCRMVACNNVSAERHELVPGIYGLSNAFLDTPWPKVGAGKTALAAALARLPDEQGIWQLLRDDTRHPDHVLPATGVSMDWERLLSAAFVRSADYGTRCSTLLTIDKHGTTTFDEQSWQPDGRPGQRCRYRYGAG